MNFLWWKEKRFKMVWRLEKGSRVGYVVGTAHFFPTSLEKPLTRLLQEVETVLFEGPLDEESMAKVAECGRKPEGGPSLFQALDPKTIEAINKEFRDRLVPSNSAESYLQQLQPSNTDFARFYLESARPWLAFFTLWSTYLGWKHSIDMEAYHIAKRLGKDIRFLETIEEQLVAMDGIPFERIVDYVNRFDQWKSYKRTFLNYFLAGELEKLMARTPRFPTRCESILGMRDARFFERMIGYYEARPSIAFLGMSHIPAVKSMFVDSGFSVIQTVA
jgi:hypothetical protein